MGALDVIRSLGGKAASYGAKGAGGIFADVAGLSGLGSALTSGSALTAAGAAGGAIAGVGGLASLLAPVGVGAYNSVTDAAFERQLRAETSALLREQAAALRRQRMETSIAINEQRLSQMPGLYNALLAGKPIPRGAAVIGGGQRPDLINLVAQSMAEGQFTPSPNQGIF